MPVVSPLRPEDARHLGNYRLNGRLGAGGQGVVFLGAGASGRPVAVKLLHARLDDASARRGFAREIEAVRRVAPFCTAQVLDADLDGDRPYLVSEYVGGPSLSEHVRAAGPRTGGDLDRVAVGTGADLHCSGRLTPTSESGEAVVLTLDQVKGDACYPGSVSITWRGESAAGFEVTREGEPAARYSGSLTRTN